LRSRLGYARDQFDLDVREDSRVVFLLQSHDGDGRGQDSLLGHDVAAAPDLDRAVAAARADLDAATFDAG